MGRWGKDDDEGFRGWRTLIYVYKEDEFGFQDREWRATWINPCRRDILESQGYQRVRTSGRGSLMAEDYTVEEDEENTWASARNARGAPVAEP